VFDLGEKLAEEDCPKFGYSPVERNYREEVAKIEQAQ
jgi:hypothetical protein